MKNVIVAWLVLVVSCIVSFGQTYQHNHYIYGGIDIRDGEYYKQLAERERRKEEYERQIDSSYTVIMQKSDVCYQNGDYEGTEYYGKQALWNIPHRRWAWTNIISARIMMDQKKEARKGYTKGYKYLDPETRRFLNTKYMARYSHELKRKTKTLLWIGLGLVSAGIIASAIIFEDELDL